MIIHPRATSKYRFGKKTRPVGPRWGLGKNRYKAHYTGQLHPGSLQKRIHDSLPSQADSGQAELSAFDEAQALAWQMAFFKRLQPLPPFQVSSGGSTMTVYKDCLALYNKLPRPRASRLVRTRRAKLQRSTGYDVEAALQRLFRDYGLTGFDADHVRHRLSSVKSRADYEAELKQIEKGFYSEKLEQDIRNKNLGFFQDFEALMIERLRVVVKKMNRHELAKVINSNYVCFKKLGVIHEHNRGRVNRLMNFKEPPPQQTSIVSGLSGSRVRIERRFRSKEAKKERAARLEAYNQEKENELREILFMYFRRFEEAIGRNVPEKSRYSIWYGLSCESDADVVEKCLLHAHSVFRSFTRVHHTSSDIVSDAAIQKAKEQLKSMPWIDTAVRGILDYNLTVPLWQPWAIDLIDRAYQLVQEGRCSVSDVAKVVNSYKQKKNPYTLYQELSCLDFQTLAPRLPSMQDVQDYVADRLKGKSVKVKDRHIVRIAEMCDNSPRLERYPFMRDRLLQVLNILDDKLTDVEAYGLREWYKRSGAHAVAIFIGNPSFLNFRNAEIQLRSLLRCLAYFAITDSWDAIQFQFDDPFEQWSSFYRYDTFTAHPAGLSDFKLNIGPMGELIAFTQWHFATKGTTVWEPARKASLVDRFNITAFEKDERPDMIDLASGRLVEVSSGYMKRDLDHPSYQRKIRQFKRHLDLIGTSLINSLVHTIYGVVDRAYLSEFYSLAEERGLADRVFFVIVDPETGAVDCTIDYDTYKKSLYRSFLIIERDRESDWEEWSRKVAPVSL